MPLLTRPQSCICSSTWHAVTHASKLLSMPGHSKCIPLSHLICCFNNEIPQCCHRIQVGVNWEMATFHCYNYRFLWSWRKVGWWQENLVHCPSLSCISSDLFLQCLQTCIGGLIQCDSYRADIIYGLHQIQRLFGRYISSICVILFLLTVILQIKYVL